MRAIFSENAYEVTGTPVRAELVVSHRFAAETRIARDAHTAGDGRQPGRQRIDQSLIKALPFLQSVRFQVIHLRGAGSTPGCRQLSPGKMSFFLGTFHHRRIGSVGALICACASGRGQPGRVRRLFVARHPDSVFRTPRMITKRAMQNITLALTRQFF